MLKLGRAILVALALSLPAVAGAGVPPVPAADHEALLRSDDARLAANKRLVYDAYRVIMIGGHVDRVGEFFTSDYIQHNPSADSGADALVAFVRALNPKPQPIPAKVPWPLVAIAAERDLVFVGLLRELPDAKDPSHMVTTTWFDMYRIQDGKIAEHWDPSTGELAKPPAK